MTTGPGDEKAAGGPGRGRFRASHADRERVIATLKAAFIQGRLTKDEFDSRVGRGARVADLCGKLAALTADLPAGLTGPVARNVPQPGTRPRHRHRARRIAGSLVAAIGVRGHHASGFPKPPPRVIVAALERRRERSCMWPLRMG